MVGLLVAKMHNVLCRTLKVLLFLDQTEQCCVSKCRTARKFVAFVWNKSRCCLKRCESVALEKRLCLNMLEVSAFPTVTFVHPPNTGTQHARCTTAHCRPLHKSLTVCSFRPRIFLVGCHPDFIPPTRRWEFVPSRLSTTPAPTFTETRNSRYRIRPFIIVWSSPSLENFGSPISKGPRVFPQNIETSKDSLSSFFQGSRIPCEGHLKVGGPPFPTLTRSSAHSLKLCNLSLNSM